MSTRSEHQASSNDDAPDVPEATAIDAATDGAPRPERTHVRDLTRWHVPFHYLPALVVTAIGVAMLLAGGTAGWFGGWWLAAALPIAIGGFLRSIWFALIPVVVWGAWLIYAGNAADTATLSNTPPLLGICLGLIGLGATVVAQRAVFPATEPGAWEPSVGRIVPPLDDGTTAPLDEHTDDHTIEFAVVEPIEASEEELEAAAIAARTDAAADADDADEPLEIAPDEPAPGEPDGAVAEFEAVEAETDDADDAEDQAEAEAEADEADDDAEDQAESEAEGEGEEDAEAVTPNELPLEADPSELDEGGHPMEFRAITDDDLAKAEAAEA